MRIWDLWLNCRTQPEIEKELDIFHGSVNNTINKVKKRQMTKNDKTPIIPDELQHFNVWKVFSLRKDQMRDTMINVRQVR